MLQYRWRSGLPWAPLKKLRRSPRLLIGQGERWSEERKEGKAKERNWRRSASSRITGYPHDANDSATSLAELTSVRDGLSNITLSDGMVVSSRMTMSVMWLCIFRCYNFFRYAIFTFFLTLYFSCTYCTIIHNKWKNNSLYSGLSVKLFCILLTTVYVCMHELTILIMRVIN